MKSQVFEAAIKACSCAYGQQLAEVYLHLDKRSDAWDQYATASDAYLQSWHVKDARRMLDRAKALNLPLDPKRMETFAGLDDAIRKKSNSVSGKPATGVA
jgi:hypothetical protein